MHRDQIQPYEAASTLLLVPMGKKYPLSPGAAEPFLVLHGKPLLRMKLTERKAKQICCRDSSQQQQSKNTEPELLPDFSVIKRDKHSLSCLSQLSSSSDTCNLEL